MGTAGRERSRLLIGGLVMAMLTAACGGGGKGSGGSKVASPTTEVSSDSTDTTAVTVPGETTTTAAASGSATGSSTTAVGSGTTKTTVKSTSKSSKTVSTAPPPTSAARVQVTAPPTTAASEPPQPGGTLNIIVNQEGAGYDPTKGTTSAGGGDSYRMFAVYDKLIYADPNTGSVNPRLAESMTTQDAKVWTLKIRPGIKFSDGTVFDANAVKFNWDRHADPANGSINGPTARNIVYEVTDPLTIRITIKSASGQFPRTISDQLSYIASPTAVTAAGSQAAYNTKPVGAGPFLLKQWVRDSQATFERNPTYWNSPKPYVDRMVIRPVLDETARYNTFQAGEADISYSTVPQTVATARSNASTNVLQSPSLNTIMFYYNLKRPPFNDVNLRRAIQLAIDIDQINKVVHSGIPEVPRGYFPANYPYSDPSIVLPSTDLAAAQKLIDAYFAATGKELVFTVTSGTTGDNASKQQTIQSQVNRLNHVKMNIELVPTTQFVTQLNQGNFDVMLYAYSGMDPEPQFAEEVLSNGSRNVQGYNNPDVDKAILESRNTVDLNVRNQALKNAQKILVGDLPFFPINRLPIFWLSRSNVRDVATFDDGGLLSDGVWLKTRD